jgi:heme O synthase-like polyprenyltransferase
MANWRAYLELMRVSNLPTVWTNTLVGLYAGYVAAVTSGALPAAPDSLTLLIGILNNGFVLFICISLLYVGGMALNDVLDEAHDRQHRPQRPIPSGRVSPKAARVFVAICFTLGLLGMALYDQPRVLMFGLLLVISIVAYNAYHRQSPMIAGFMGLCRALVVVTASAAMPGDDAVWLQIVLPIAVCLYGYIVLLTIVARLEIGTELGRARWAAPAMIPIALAPAAILPTWTAGDLIWILASGGLLVFWLSRAAIHAMANPPRTIQAILFWLSGICLLDAFYLCVLGQPGAAGVAVACWGLTAWGHRRISGT